MNLNDLAKTVHAANIRWWQDLETGEPLDRNDGEMLMLVITELSEAVDGIRKNLMDDKLPHRKMEEVEMADTLIRLLDFSGGRGLILTDIQPSSMDIGTVPKNKCEAILLLCGKIFSVYQHVGDKVRCGDLVSIAIVEIRTYCAAFCLDLDGAYSDKMLFNSKRKDHTIAHRKSEGGKKF